MPLLTETFPLLVHIGAYRYDAVAIQKMADEFETYFARGERYAVISVQPKDSLVPGASERKLIADWANSERVQKCARQLCVGAATVIDGPLMRGAFTAILWFWKLPFPLEVVATPPQAVEYCIGQLLRTGVSLGKPGDLMRTRALSLLKAALDERSS